MSALAQGKRSLVIAAAQMGAIQPSDSRADVVARMVRLLTEAKARGAELVVFPELTLTTFFPRYFIEAGPELDKWYETQMPSPETQPLFDAVKKLGLMASFGYAELVQDNDRTRHFNTSIIINSSGEIVSKYRKIHLPGHDEYDPNRTFQHLEKRYFETGDYGFKVWDHDNVKMGLCICNDRRWPETFRVLGLQDVELVLIGYNTPAHNAKDPEPPHRRAFYNHLSVQAGAYQNSTWVVSVAKAGCEDGQDLMGGSCIVSPYGEIIAQAMSTEDELIIAKCDMEMCRDGKENMFNFAKHRRPEFYGKITQPHSEPVE
ncbi:MULTISPECIES: N-carbamoyl-D-amino-acid hydrolase [Leisingera]|uniref:N-carbamoyl-D-amino-acid hydrolase n=1 Tax=Leisingera TaxID=191028 RepID=UPI001C95CCBF|nr:MULTISPECIES: N-carbamoyl-D-amino-acid hydrolase [Leisingera]MBY6059609.1 N-carbamoyl-D-amino-acid hydrolase [Leisingera daeponensis]